MNKAFEKILDRLEEVENRLLNESGDIGCTLGITNMYEYSKQIVQEVAEEFSTDTNVGTNGWIPCSDRLPDDAFGCLVTVIDCEPSTQTDFENILPYFVGYDGDSWNDADGEEIPFEVIAWRKLPTPYQPKGE